MHQIYLKFSVSVPATVLCLKLPANFALYRHFKPPFWNKGFWDDRDITELRR